MQGRWRGRAGLAIGLVVAGAIFVGFVVARGPDERWLVVHDAAGEVIARHAVEPGDRIGLRYRNSVYGSLAEEWFTVTTDDRLHLEEIAADELAVLEEYYAINGPARPTGARTGERAFAATPADRLALIELSVAATDLGQRTLLVPGDPAVELWRLVDDSEPTVTLRVEWDGP